MHPAVRSMLMIKPSLDLDFFGPTLDPRVVFSRASAANAYGSNGLMTSISTGVARCDYDPVTLQPLGLLMEETRVNNALRSAAFSNASWTKTNVSVTTDSTTDPTGGTLYDTLTSSATDGTVLQTVTGLVTSTQYCLSIDLMRVTGTGTVSITADGTNYTTVALTGTMTRFSILVTTGSTSTTIGIKIATNGDAVAAGGAQLEAGAYPTTRLTTSASTVSRSSDTAQLNLPDAWYAEGAISLYVEVQPIQQNSATSQRLIALSDGTSTNRLLVTFNSGGQISVALAVSGFSTLTITASSTITLGTVYKVLVVVSSSAMSLYANGVLIGTSRLNSVPVAAMNTLNIGPAGGTGVAYLRRVKAFRTVLTNTHAQALTS